MLGGFVVLLCWMIISGMLLRWLYLFGMCLVVGIWLIVRYFFFIVCRMSGVKVIIILVGVFVGNGMIGRLFFVLFSLVLIWVMMFLWFCIVVGV